MTNIHPTAEVHPSVQVPASSKVWNYAQIREGVTIGENCIIGRNVYIGPGVSIGNNCKIQNNALIYEPALIEDGVFIGPAVVLTNDKRPRAINSDGSIKSASDWEPVGVTIRKGASVGASSVCVAPVELGEWSAVGANSVVTRDITPGHMVAGNPARDLGEAKY
jgi:UDP-2-acetamido-3-amino-2,3-dideoxy-glucuronate N-acetyltransferase